MSERVFDRDTVLNLVINIIPLGIILFFVFLFFFFDPFGSDVVAVFYSQLLLVVPFICLAVVTYYAGKIISETEKTGSSKTAASITRTIIGEVATESPPDESEVE